MAQISLPVTDPVLIVALAMGIFLVAPLLFERIRIPGIIGLIVAGAVVGPHGAGLLDRDPTIVLLGTVGLLYLVFLAGLELDLHGFARYRRRSIIFGLISFSAPMALAIAVMPFLGFGIPATLLIGSIIGSHTLLAYPIVSRLGLVKNPAVTTVVGGTLVTDTLALAVLTIIAGSMGEASTPIFWITLLAGLALYVGLVFWGVPRLGLWFFRNTPGHAPAEFIFLMVVLFTSSYMAQVAGAQPIIGAFLAGLTLNRLIPNEGPLMNRIRFVGNALFVPFFLLSVGMLVDTRVLTGGAGVWVLAGAFIVLVHLGKLVGALIPQRLFGYTKAEGILMFGLSVPQAAATLAVTFIGLEIGLFDEAVVNAVIMMILVTGLVGPSIVERYGHGVALLDDQKPYDPESAPQRILVPMANPATASDLLDLAFIAREPDSNEPIYPITVVPAEEERSGEFVAMAEKMLSHAVAYAAGADVPVVPLTRVDHNFANGIARGAAETRTSTLIIGWDGKRSHRRGVFGTVLDQLLEQSKQQVLVAKMGHPLNTTERIVLLVPQGTDHVPGFLESIRLVKRMANRLGATIQGYGVTASGTVYQAHLDGIKPEAPTVFEQLPGWPEVLEVLQKGLRPNDLVIVLSARRGAVSWSPSLERLPGRLAGLVPESFIMMYPSEVAPAVPRFSRDSALPHALAPDRVVFDLPKDDYRELLRRLLESEFAEDPVLLERITAALVRSIQAFAAEIRPGVVVPHTRVAELDRSLVFLGICRDGAQFPQSDEPARLVFVLLTPEDKPGEHLAQLAEIARLVSDPERVERLLEAATPEELAEAVQ